MPNVVSQVAPDAAPDLATNVLTFPRAAGADAAAAGDPVLGALREIADQFLPLGLKLRDSRIAEEEKALALALMLQAAHSVMATTRLYIDALQPQGFDRAV